MTKTNKVEPKKESKTVAKSYVVLHPFKDSEDANKVYKKDNKFNASGKSKERIKELSGRNNNIGVRLIELNN